MALDFFGGCFGGCAGVLVGHPFDTVKVHLQTQDAKKGTYRGTFHCMSTIIKKESFFQGFSEIGRIYQAKNTKESSTHRNEIFFGMLGSVRGLYKGMSSPMVGLAGVNAIVFGTYGNLQRAHPSPDSLSSHFIAGSAAGLVQSLVSSPMELAKTRMQLQEHSRSCSTPYWRKKPAVKYKNPLDCLMKVLKTEGVKGFYRGFWCTVLRDSPGFGVYFSGYEFLTQKVTNTNGNISTLALLLAGGLAGVISWIVIYPADVVKSRMQVDGMNSARKYDGFWDCVTKSYKSEGLKAFTRGLNSTIIRAFPTNAATFAVFTWFFMFWESQVREDSKVMRAKDLMIEKKFAVVSIADTWG